MTALMREVDDATAAELDRIGAVAAAEDAEPTAATESGVAPTAAAGPVFTVLKGNPSDVELAALIAVLSAAAASRDDATTVGRAVAETWGHPTLMHRTTTVLSPATFGTAAHLRQ